MAFTDDDLKWAKEWATSYPYVVRNNDFDRIKDLIARLEAAEVLAECLSNHNDLDPVEITEIKNWRKAAGK